MQNIWTTPVDLKKGVVEIYNENFFKDISNVRLVWEVVCEGKTVANGSEEALNVNPQERKQISLKGYSLPESTKGKEVMLNVDYKLKSVEPLLDAGYSVARQQLEISSYKFPTLDEIMPKAEVAEKAKKKQTEEKVVKEEQIACLSLQAAQTTVTFNKKTGWIDYLDINEAPAFKKGYSLKPEFWRAPTDNDYGANLQTKFAAWKDPQMNLKKFECKEVGEAKQVVAEYELPTVSSKLVMTYTLRTDGQLVVNEKLTTDPNAKEKPMMFRFGMQLVMPQEFSKLQYYGRGPGENYADRHWGDRIGVYNQNVADQYWGYVRPQESGNHTDIRWWKVLSNKGTGLEFYSNIPMECSSLNYLTEDLDGGPDKYAHQYHSGDLTPRKFTVVKIQERQFGVGGIDSWGQWPEPEVQMPYADHDFTFVINPIASAN